MSSLEAPPMASQSDSQVQENSISGSGVDANAVGAGPVQLVAKPALLSKPQPQPPPASAPASALAKQQQKQQSQFVMSSAPLHAKATTAGVLAGGTLHRVKSAQKLYAKAMYDNIPDTPDELPFKKGEILTVIEQDTEGYKGWWLCSLRDKKGLCPGNRLRVINSYDSGFFSPSPASSPIPSLAASTATLNSSICSTEIYENSSIISAGNGEVGGSQLHLNQQLGQAQSQSQSQSQSQTSQARGSRMSWHASSNKGTSRPHRSHINGSPTPLSVDHQIYSNDSIYQNLQNLSIMSVSSNGSGSGGEFETYDIPKPATPVNYDSPKNVAGACRTPTSASALSQRFESLKNAPIEEESYDVPRSLNPSLLQQQPTMTPSSSVSSLLTSDSVSLSFSSSNRSSLANMPDYDIPRRNPIAVRAIQQLTASRQNSTNCPTYDFPLPPVQEQERRAPTNGQLLDTTKELPLEMNSALDTLAKLQSEMTMAITRLLSFVVPNWRSRAQLERVIMELKLAVLRLRTALHDLAEFGECALGNATRSEDPNLALKLRPLVRALRDANKLIHDSSEALDAQGCWSVEQLARDDEKHGCRPPDSLDQLMACAQTLTEDVRSTTSFIQGNASLLFKRQPPTGTLTTNGQDSVDGSASASANSSGSRTSADWLEDYDYVSLESKDVAAKRNQILRDALPPNIKDRFDAAIKLAENTAMASTVATAPLTPTANNNSITKVQQMSDKDKKVVYYYAQSISMHMGNLLQAIDSFFETVKKNQPPKYFIAYGKFVVVSAHHLVNIGDNVYRNISKETLREKILRCTNGLSDALRTCVLKSKKAAAHFPSGSAVQEMVDSVEHINQTAHDLKLAMLQAVQLSS